MSAAARTPLSGEFARFVIAGLVNTGVSLAAYWALLFVAPYAAAYSLSFAIGVLTAFTLNTYFVFGTSWSWSALFAFPLVQGANYVVGLSVLTVLIQGADMSASTAPLISIPMTIPVNFVMTRWLMRRASRRGDQDPRSPGA